MFEILTGFVRDTENLVVAAINILALVFVAWTWWRTKALATTLGALLFAALIVFGVNNIDILSLEIEEDVRERGNRPAQAGSDPRARSSGR